MKTNNALSVVEMIRCAGKAAAAYRAAQHAVREAHDEHGAAQAQLNHWNDHIHALGGPDRASPAHSALLAAIHDHQEAEQKVRKAEARLQRASATLQGHRPTLNRYPLQRNQARATTVLLDRLADHPVDLMRAADLIIIQTSQGKIRSWPCTARWPRPRPRAACTRCVPCTATSAPPSGREFGNWPAGKPSATGSRFWS